MSGQCWEMVVQQLIRRSVSEAHSVLGEVKTAIFFANDVGTATDLPSSYLITIPEQAETSFDMATQDYGERSVGWLSSLGSGIVRAEDVPWAIVALDREYRLAGHLRETKGKTTAVRFAQ